MDTLSAIPTVISERDEKKFILSKVKSWGRLVTVRPRNLSADENDSNVGRVEDTADCRSNIPNYDSANACVPTTKNNVIQKDIVGLYSASSNKDISLNTDLVYVWPQTSEFDVNGHKKIHGPDNFSEARLFNATNASEPIFETNEHGLTLDQLENSLRNMERRLEASMDQKLERFAARLQQTQHISVSPPESTKEPVRKGHHEHGNHHGDSEERLSNIEQRLVGIAEHLGVDVPVSVWSEGSRSETEKKIDLVLREA